MLEIGLAHYLSVAAILFTLGIFGIFLNRKNVIVILMSIELMLNAANLAFVGFSRQHADVTGQIFVLMVIVVAAAEAAVALAIVLNLYNTFNTIDVDEANSLRE